MQIPTDPCTIGLTDDDLRTESVHIVFHEYEPNFDYLDDPLVMVARNGIIGGVRVA